VKGCAKTRGLARPKPEEWLTQGDYAPAEFVPAYLMGAAGYVRPDLGFKHCLFKSIETPYLANYVAQFPAMKFVHIVRHPVPVCSSQKRSLFENKKLPGSHIGLDWLVCMMKHRWLPHARFIAEHQYDPRHIVVRYESLVSDPNGEISRVAKALGLAPPARPDEQTVFYDQGVDDWGHNPSKPGVKTPNKAVANLQEKYGYQEILSKREIDLILYKASPYLTALGYPQAEPVAFSSLLWESLLPDQWELMHCRTLRLKGRAVLAMLNRRSFLLS
jgi:hypothetical protein